MTDSDGHELPWAKVYDRCVVLSVNGGDEEDAPTDVMTHIASIDKRFNFDHKLQDHFKEAGFDEHEFNIAVVGANNTGKSTFLNTLFTGGERRCQEMFQRASAKVQHLDPTIDSKLEALKDQFEMGDGRCTQWPMLKEGKSSKDVRVWIPRGHVWDLPGIELTDNGVEEYVEKGSVNHFDASFLVVDRMLQMDDYFLLMHLQKAKVNGMDKPGGVPFFLVKNKMDNTIVDLFKVHIKAGKPAQEFEVDWPAVIENARNDLLADLPRANAKFAGDDPMKTQTDVLIKPEYVVFSGLIENITREIDGHHIPYPVVEQVAKLFDEEARFVRRRLWAWAKGKAEIVDEDCERLGKASPKGAGRGGKTAHQQVLDEKLKHCCYSKLCEALYECGLAVVDNGMRDVVIDITTEDDKLINLGFSVKPNTMEIVKPSLESSEDKRAHYGIEDDDVLKEFPIRCPIKPRPRDPNASNLEKIMNDSGLKAPFKIVIQRLCQDITVNSFRKTKFKTVYAGSVATRPVTIEEYDEAVRAIVFDHGKHFSVSAANSKQFLSDLMNDRKDPRTMAPLSTVCDIAISDWCSAKIQYNEGRVAGEVEFCTMVNACLRRDDHSSIRAVATCLQAMRFALLVDRSGGEPEPPIEDIPEDGMLIRGTSMPASIIHGTKEEEPFFVKDKKYRSKQFIASSSDTSLGIKFCKRSKRWYPERVPVLMFFDASCKPYHVRRINNKLGEAEFLWAPYSCFQVTEVNKEEVPVKIFLKAFKDNVAAHDEETHDSDDWPLAEWH